MGETVHLGVVFAVAEKNAHKKKEGMASELDLCLFIPLINFFVLHAWGEERNRSNGRVTEKRPFALSLCTYIYKGLCVCLPGL